MEVLVRKFKITLFSHILWKSTKVLVSHTPKEYRSGNTDRHLFSGEVVSIMHGVMGLDKLFEWEFWRENRHKSFLIFTINSEGKIGAVYLLLTSTCSVLVAPAVFFSFLMPKPVFRELCSNMFRKTMHPILYI